MATRLYFHAAAFDTGSFPGNYPDSDGDVQLVIANPQPSFGISGADATSVNRSMTKTKGTSQTSFAIVRSATSSATQSSWVGKFISDPLENIDTIDAEVWSSQTAKMEDSGNSNWAGAFLCLYVWRPSTNAKVGSSIYPATGEGGFAEPSTANTQRLGIGNVTAGTGAQVTGVEDGDVLVLEVFFRKTTGASSTFTDTWFYDGTTEYDGQSNQDIVTDMAAFIQTPQDLTFVTDAPPDPIAMTLEQSALIEDMGLLKV